MKSVYQLACVTLLSLLSCGTTISAEKSLYYIDALSQLDAEVKDLNVIIRQMDEAGVYRTILSTHGRRKGVDIIKLARQYPGRIIPAVRVSSWAYFKNKPKFYEVLKRQVRSGKFGAMSQATLYQGEKQEADVPEILIQPNEEQAQAVIRAAIKKGWPVIFKVEFQAFLGGANRKRLMKGLEDTLANHPQHPFVLNELGQLEPNELRKLIEKHKNIYFLTSHSNPGVSFARVQTSWVNLFEGEKLKPEWKALFVQHSGRFIFALSNAFAMHWYEDYQNQMKYWHSAMQQLPEEVAHAIAHGNAERLWNLAPKN